MADTVESAPEANHGSPAWIPRFVSWAREEVDALDFEGASVPDRVRDLLKGAGVRAVHAKPHGHVEPEHDIPDDQPDDEGEG